MKTIKLLMPAFSMFLLSISPVYSQQYTWTQQSDYGGGMVYSAFSFVINSKGYVGGGILVNGTLKNDFWEYDPTSNIWTQKANLPGVGRYGARGFSANGFGYMGTGWIVSGTSSFYRYNPATNSWNQLANFGGSPRYTSSAFAVGGSGYIGLGFTPCKNDFWRYNSSNDTWTQMAIYPGSPRQAAVSFVINDIAYVGGGLCPGTLYNDFYKYDYTINAWSPAASFPGTPRNAAFAFAINNLGYVGMGYDYLGNNQPFNILSDFWQYDPVADSWLQLTDFPGTKRYEGISFAINNRGYVGLGSDTISSTHYLSDFWEYGPVSTSIKEIKSSTLNIYPSPASSYILLDLKDTDVLINIMNMSGQTVLKVHDCKRGLNKIFVNELNSGLYHCIISKKDEIISKGKFVKM